MDASTESRLTEVMLYIAERCANHRYFGKTKLNKILFAADFWSYAERQESITGAKYINFERGPVPDEGQALISRLQHEGEIHLEQRHGQLRVMPSRPARMDDFSRNEIRTIDEAIGHLRDMTADEVSEWSHQWSGWKHTRVGEEIPYFTALLPLETGKPVRLPDDIEEWARSAVR